MTEPIIKDILPRDIVFDAGTQARVKTDLKTCESYIESMQNGDTFPLPDVFNDGISEKFILADGFHRFQSHDSFRPNEPIRCRVHFGTLADAKIFAAGANSDHGLRRTSEDKRKAVKIILQEPSCEDWSNRRIADHVRVSEFLVRTVRQELEKGAIKSQVVKRVGKDGKMYPVSLVRYDHLDEPPEPETSIRTNADGKQVNVMGFDFTAKRRCSQCEFWSQETGICDLNHTQLPSWAPGCTDWYDRYKDIESYEPPQPTRLRTRKTVIPTRKNSTKSHYVRQKHVSCRMYPENPELSAVQIRDALGSDFLKQLVEAARRIEAED